MKTISENNIAIFENSITMKNTTTLYFILNLYNYSLYSSNSISQQLTVLYNFISNLESNISEIKFSLFRFEDIVSPESYEKEFIETIQMWNPGFKPGEEFLSNIHSLSSQYCFFAVTLDPTKANSVDDISIKSIVRSYKDIIVDFFADFRQTRIDKTNVKSTTTKILNLGQDIVKPCTEKMLLSYYIKRVFPSYNIVIPENEIDQTKAVISYLRQELKPYLNYFEMSNSGVEIFGAEAVTTYGTIIDIVDFPEEVEAEYFSLCHDGLVCNCKTLPKDKAKLLLNRKQADIDFELETAETAGSADAAVELEDYSDTIQTGLAALSLGKKIVEGDVHILITANSVESLNEKRFDLISKLKNLNIIATFSPDQAKTYIDSFIKLSPTKYNYLFDLMYPLSWKLDTGSAVGDFDSEFTTPIIGEYCTRAEATINA